jgi:hypothetical protein
MHDPLQDAGLGVPIDADGYRPEGRPLIPGQDATPNRLRKDRKCGINCVLFSLFLFCLLGAIGSCVFNGGRPLL